MDSVIDHFRYPIPFRDRKETWRDVEECYEETHIEQHIAYDIAKGSSAFPLFRFGRELWSQIYNRWWSWHEWLQKRWEIRRRPDEVEGRQCVLASDQQINKGFPWVVGWPVSRLSSGKAQRLTWWPGRGRDTKRRRSEPLEPGKLCLFDCRRLPSSSQLQNVVWFGLVWWDSGMCEWIYINIKKKSPEVFLFLRMVRYVQSELSDGESLRSRKELKCKKKKEKKTPPEINWCELNKQTNNSNLMWTPELNEQLKRVSTSQAKERYGFPQAYSFHSHLNKAPAHIPLEGTVPTIDSTVDHVGVNREDRRVDKLTTRLRRAKVERTYPIWTMTFLTTLVHISSWSVQNLRKLFKGGL